MTCQGSDPRVRYLASFGTAGKAVLARRVRLRDGMARQACPGETRFCSSNLSCCMAIVAGKARLGIASSGLSWQAWLVLDRRHKGIAGQVKAG